MSFELSLFSPHLAASTQLQSEYPSPREPPTPTTSDLEHGSLEPRGEQRVPEFNSNLLTDSPRPARPPRRRNPVLATLVFLLKTVCAALLLTLLLFPLALLFALLGCYFYPAARPALAWPLLAPTVLYGCALEGAGLALLVAIGALLGRCSPPVALRAAVGAEPDPHDGLPPIVFVALFVPVMAFAIGVGALPEGTGVPEGLDEYMASYVGATGLSTFLFTFAAPCVLLMVLECVGWDKS